MYLFIHTNHKDQGFFSLERKYQKPYDYIDKGPKQEMKIKAIHTASQKNKELEAKNKIPGRLSLMGNVQTSHGNHILNTIANGGSVAEKIGTMSRADDPIWSSDNILFFHHQTEKSSILIYKEFSRITKTINLIEK